MTFHYIDQVILNHITGFSYSLALKLIIIHVLFTITHLFEKAISDVRMILFLFLSRPTLFPRLPVFPATLILSSKNFSCT